MSSKKEVAPELAAKVTPEVTEAVLEAAIDGRVACAKLRLIAEDLGVQYKVAGAAADLEGVSVHGCDLGCF